VIITLISTEMQDSTHTPKRCQH